MRTCCFTGHRMITDDERRRLETVLDETVEKLILLGVRTFYTGGALGFDTLAAESVIRLKEKYHGVGLHLILPCRDQCKNWSVSAIRRYKRILDMCDGFEYIDDFYRNGIMHERNRRMVELSDVCVAYVKHDGGGSAYTLRYAKKCGKDTVNIAF